MQGEDQGLAQAVFLAQMYAQGKECECTSCQLLRKATAGMIAQVLAGQSPAGASLDPQAVAKLAGSLGLKLGEAK